MGQIYKTIIRTQVQNIHWIIFALGFCLLLGGGIWYLSNYVFIHNSESAEAVVIANIPKSEGVSPMVQFTTENNEVITYTSTTTQHPPQYAVGDTVTVYYKPADPQDATLDGFLNLWFGPIMLGGAGVIDCIVGLIFLHRSKQNLGE